MLSRHKDRAVLTQEPRRCYRRAGNRGHERACSMLMDRCAGWSLACLALRCYLPGPLCVDAGVPGRRIPATPPGPGRESWDRWRGWSHGWPSCRLPEGPGRTSWGRRRAVRPGPGQRGPRRQSRVSRGHANSRTAQGPAVDVVRPAQSVPGRWAAYWKAGRISNRRIVSRIRPPRNSMPKRREKANADATNHRGQISAGYSSGRSAGRG
jgi:hypothetical protein